MEPDADEQIYDLRAALGAVRRRLALILAFTVVAGGLALVVSAAQEDRFRATAVLLFRDPGLDPQILGRPALLGGEQILDRTTNVGLVSLDAVAERTAEELGGGASPGAVTDAIEVTEGSGPELVEVIAETATGAGAAETANAYADAFLDLRREEDLEAIRSARRSVERDLAALPDALQETARAEELRRQAAELRTLELLQTGDAQLVERADVPSSPSSPKPLRNGLLAGIAGLIFGLAAALLLERLDPRPRSRRDAERAFGAPVLAEVPADPRLKEAPLGPAGTEAFRTLAMRLRFSDRERPPRSVLFVSARSYEGRTTIAANLARALVADGESVTLLEADFRGPELAVRSAVAAAPGLAEYLDGACNLDEATREVELADRGEGSLRIVVAGTPPASPTAPLSDEGLPELIGDLAADRDRLLIDAPALGEVADAVPLVAAVDAVIVVASLGDVKRAQAEELRSQLEALGAPVIGIVLNRA